MSTYGVFIGVTWIAVFGFAVWRVFSRRRRGGLGAGASGAYYEMLSKDRREAIQVVVEKRAERQDREHRDGNLPELDARGAKR